MPSMRSRIALALLVVTLAGCSGSPMPSRGPSSAPFSLFDDYYVPNARAPSIDPETPIFTGAREISIVNRQAPNREQFLIKDGFTVYKANLRDWSDAAIALLAEELEGQGLVLREDAAKILEVQVANVQTIRGRWVTRCIVTLQVGSGDGKWESYQGVRVSSRGFERAANAAVMTAVATALNSEQVKAYLNN